MDLSNQDPDSLLERRIVLLRGSIDENLATVTVARILYLADQSEDELCLLLDSPGGSFIGAATLLDVIEDVRPAVVTHANRAQGLALSILAQGARGRRSADPSARLSIEALRDDRTGVVPPGPVASVTQQLLSRTRLSEAQVERGISAGLRLEPGEAVAAGIVDQLLLTDDVLSRGA